MGVVFSLVTAALFALANVYNRKTDKKYSGLEAMALSVALCALFFFPLSVIVKLIDGSPWPDYQTFLLYIAIGVISAFWGRWGLFTIIRYLGPSRASVIKNSAPAFALLLGFLLLDQWPTTLSLIGIITILAAIWLMGWRSEPKKTAAAPAEQASGLTRWQKGMLLGALVALIFALADVIRTFAVIRAPNDIILASGVMNLAGWISLSLWLMYKGQFVETYRKHWNSLDKNILMVTLCSILSSITNFMALKLLMVAYVSALIATAPLLTAMFSFLLARNDEKFGTTFFISALMMVGGAILIGLFK